jgi:hypothetical protein
VLNVIGLTIHGIDMRRWMFVRPSIYKGFGISRAWPKQCDDSRDEGDGRTFSFAVHIFILDKVPCRSVWQNDISVSLSGFSWLRIQTKTTSARVLCNFFWFFCGVSFISGS